MTADEDLAREVRWLIANPPPEAWEGGPRWDDGFGQDRTGWLLRRFSRSRAWDLFGEASLRAAIRTRVPATCCRFGMARVWATVLGTPMPKPGPALVALLGRPCMSCAVQIAAESKAAAQDDAADRRIPAPRSAASSILSLTAGPAAPLRGRRLVANPDYRELPRPSRVPTEAEDRAFLRSMAHIPPSPRPR